MLKLAGSFLVVTASLLYGWRVGRELQEHVGQLVGMKEMLLMLHGEKDGLVSVEDTYEFFRQAASKDKQMKVYGNLFHEIFNEYCKDEVIQDALSWIERRI